MKEEYKYDFLITLKYSDNIKYLHEKGYNYVDIYSFIKSLKQRKYLDDNYHVTTKGDLFIYLYERKHKIKKYSKWIMHNSKVWKKPISFYDVYFPNN